MVTETKTGQQTGLAESSEKGQISEEVKSPTSESGKEVATPAPYDTPEFKKAVETAAFRLMDSRLDKIVKPLHDKISVLEKREMAIKESEQDAVYDKLIEEGEDAGKVKSLKELVQDLKTKRKQFEQDVAAHTEREGKVNELASAITKAQAIKTLMSKLVPDHALLLEKAEQLVKDSKGDPDFMGILAERIVAEHKAELEKALNSPSPKRPDTSISSVSKGVTGKLTPRQLIEQGLKEK